MPAPDLWLEGGREEERMVGQLDCFHAGVRSGRPDDHAGAFERLDEGGIEAVAAVVEPVERGRRRRSRRTGCRAPGSPFELPVEAAREPGDDRGGRIRVALRVRGIADPRAAARQLDERVLEAAAGSQERSPRVEAVADGRERSIGIAVGRAG